MRNLYIKKATSLLKHKAFKQHSHLHIDGRSRSWEKESEYKDADAEDPPFRLPPIKE